MAQYLNASAGLGGGLMQVGNDFMRRKWEQEDYEKKLALEKKRIDEQRAYDEAQKASDREYDQPLKDAQLALAEKRAKTEELKQARESQASNIALAKSSSTSYANVGNRVAATAPVFDEAGKLQRYNTTFTEAAPRVTVSNRPPAVNVKVMGDRSMQWIDGKWTDVGPAPAGKGSKDPLMAQRNSEGLTRSDVTKLYNGMAGQASNSTDSAKAIRSRLGIPKDANLYDEIEQRKRDALASFDRKSTGTNLAPVLEGVNNTLKAGFGLMQDYKKPEEQLIKEAAAGEITPQRAADVLSLQTKKPVEVLGSKSEKGVAPKVAIPVTVKELGKAAGVSVDEIQEALDAGKTMEQITAQLTVEAATAKAAKR